MSAPRSQKLRDQWESGERAWALRAALDHWDALLSSGDDLHWLERALRASGLAAESAALQVHLARQHPTNTSWERVIENVLHSGDPWWARALLSEHGAESRRLQALGVEIDLAVGDASARIAAWERAYDDEAARDAAVGWWIAAGKVEEAERLLAAHAGLDHWRARLALWRGDTQEARQRLAALAPSEETRLLDAAAMVLEGRAAKAEVRLRELLAGDVAAEAWSWLATALRTLGRYEDARQAADAAYVASPAFSVAPRLERELATVREQRSGGSGRRPPRFDWLRRKLGRSRERRVRDLEYAPLLYPLGLAPDDPLDKLELALACLGGNRTPTPTIVTAGRLRSLHLPLDPRQLGATLQVVLWTRGLAAVRELYEEMGRRVDHHPTFEIYRGEIELWMGEYAAAEEIFRGILARERMTRWAWIGLGASVMQQGDLAAAQKTWAEGVAVTQFEGPTLFVWRGECWRRQGEFERARRDLEHALQQKPQRLSARINLALLDEDAERTTAAVRECEAFAPILMEETRGTPHERLEAVLGAMRGNRSSSPWLVSYHLWGRIWRRAEPMGQ